jgi:hypothetical protein
MQEADKLTLGQNITLQVRHQVTSLLNSTTSQWMTGEQMARYQSLLGENLQIKVKAMRTVNLATYLSKDEGKSLQSCEEIFR